MPEAIVLGAGMVGGVIAADLATDPDLEVTLADRAPRALERARQRASRLGGRIDTVEADLSEPGVLSELIAPFDIAVGALPSRIGFAALRTVIESRKPYCDITFMAEDAWTLDELARDRGVCAVVDFGVAPGMSHVLAGYGASRLTACESIAIYVGGLPVEPRAPFHFKAAFAPADVIEEYRRPVRLVEDGELVVREALSEPEPIEFDGVGRLEAFNTDGLRSLTRTRLAPFMKEKTIRHPDHAGLMRVFRETGLFDDDPVRVDEHEVRPVDVLGALLIPRWTYDEGEEDLTAMRVVVDGTEGGAPVRLTWELLDRYDRSSATSSMARTTGFPCALMARELASGRFERPGVITPEIVGRDAGLVDRLLEGLRSRGVEFVFSRGRPGTR